MSERQKQLFVGQEWVMAMSASFDTHHIVNHRCESLNLTRSAVTPKGKTIPEVTYFVDGDKTQYKDLADVANVLIDSGKLNVFRFPANAQQ